MGARQDSWMPIYWGDHLRDTMHLTAEGHGAYLLLIAAYWTTGKPLPDDDDHLMTVARLSPRAVEEAEAGAFRILPIIGWYVDT